MITRGIVVDKEKGGTKFKVRIPILDGIEGNRGATANEDLSLASSICFSGIRVNYEIGDIVVIGFEDNNIGIPIILGHLNLVDREMPSRVTGNFMDLESNALSVNCNVSGTNSEVNLLNINNNELSIGGINYLSLTNSESSTILYDKTSPSPEINWGYPKGILGGAMIEGKDFSSYDYLRITYFGYDINCIYFINLRTNDYKEDTNTYMGLPISDYKYGGGGTIIRPSTDPEVETYYSTALVSVDKKKFYHYQCGYAENGVYQVRNQNSLYYISKIEGIKRN